MQAASTTVVVLPDGVGITFLAVCTYPFFFFKQKTAYEIGLGIPAEPLFRSRLNVDGMNIISNDGSNKLNRSRKARVSYKVQRTINASLNAATSTRAVSSNPNFVTRQKIEIIFG